MKFTELKDKDLNELQALLKEKKSELFALRVQLRHNQVTKTSQISSTRKDIARISTAITKKKNDKDSK